MNGESGIGGKGIVREVVIRGYFREETGADEVTVDLTDWSPEGIASLLWGFLLGWENISEEGWNSTDPIEEEVETEEEFEARFGLVLSLDREIDPIFQFSNWRTENPADPLTFCVEGSQLGMGEFEFGEGGIYPRADVEDYWRTAAGFHRCEVEDLPEIDGRFYSIVPPYKPRFRLFSRTVNWIERTEDLGKLRYGWKKFWRRTVAEPGWLTRLQIARVVLAFSKKGISTPQSLKSATEEIERWKKK